MERIGKVLISKLTPLYSIYMILWTLVRISFDSINETWTFGQIMSGYLESEHNAPSKSGIFRYSQLSWGYISLQRWNSDTHIAYKLSQVMSLSEIQNEVLHPHHNSCILYLSFMSFNIPLVGHNVNYCTKSRSLWPNVPWKLGHWEEMLVIGFWSDMTLTGIQGILA